MYISKWNLLTKKVNWKNISVKILWVKILENDIKNLTNKELQAIKNLENFKNFEEKIYNKNILEKIIFDSKLLFNNLDFEKQNKYDYFYKINFIQKFVYESNRAEWSKIKQEEVFKIFENKKSNHKNKNEILEVKNSKKVFDFMNEKFIFNVSNIKKIYHILTKDLLMNSWDKYPRGFKKVENIVNNDITSKPENVERDLESLILWYKQNKKKLFSLELAYLFHLKFEKIHPFIDWNWRIWRFLINKILIDNNYFPLILFSDNKKSFFNSIKNSWVAHKKYFKTMLEQHWKSMEYFEEVSN